MWLSEWFTKKNGNRSDESGLVPRRGAIDRRGAGGLFVVREVLQEELTQYFIL